MFTAAAATAAWYCFALLALGALAVNVGTIAAGRDPRAGIVPGAAWALTAALAYSTGFDPAVLAVGTALTLAAGAWTSRTIDAQTR